MLKETAEDYVVVGPKPSEPRIASVIVDGPRHLILEYETGERKRFGIAPWLDGFNGSFRARLGDERYFRQARVIDGGMAVGWPQGPDIGPEDLFDLSTPVE